ncbi:hypothetical protein KCP75_10190 [Salmonella enterica subsp. enterica]|nr:hypothetical protein KCP75_10190 [Salmonella enterica subsp. enterica]
MGILHWRAGISKALTVKLIVSGRSRVQKLAGSDYREASMKAFCQR